jgi:hypothetical protein
LSSQLVTSVSCINGAALGFPVVGAPESIMSSVVAV